jgi:uncharacterized damage-inducible protein DinB
VNDGLIDGFRHNTWATSLVLAACQDLTQHQLDTTVPGTFGSVIDTLRHLVASEGGYCRRLTGDEPEWLQRARETESVAELARYNDELATRWERFLATPFDAERVFVMDWDDGSSRDVPAGVVLMQVLHHANEHRTQVNTALTTLGVTPPELGVWEFAAATERAPRHAT